MQISVEGVEQLESYFGSYLPQLFYAVLAPLTLFALSLIHILMSESRLSADDLAQALKELENDGSLAR